MPAGPPVRPSKLFNKYPDKKALRKYVERWGIGSNFIELMEWKRGGIMDQAPKHVLQFDAAMAMYFRQHALRAPQMPPKMRDPDTGGELLTLYRGVTFDSSIVNRLLRHGHFADDYFAFSRSRKTAFGYASFNARPGHEIMLFRLRLTDVPRGTPWVWFTGDRDLAKNAAVVRGQPRNNEVLLPKGDLKFLRREETTLALDLPHMKLHYPVHMIDVAFRPVSEEASWVALKAALKFKSKGAWGRRGAPPARPAPPTTASAPVPK